MTKVLLGAFFFFSLLFFSCIEYKQVAIQTLKPAEFSLPRNFVQPKIVVNYYKGIANDEESMARAAIDSTAADEAARALRSFMYDSPMFDNVSIPISFNLRTDVSPYINPLDWNAVETICSNDSADMLISLDYINVSPDFTSYSYYEGYSKLYYGNLTNKLVAFWRVYNLNDNKRCSETLIRDTITWDKSDFTPLILGQQLPGLFSAAAYSGYFVAEKYAKRIVPVWVDEQRIYFSRGSSEMKVASQFVEKSKWLDAAAQWQKVIAKSKKSPKLAARAAYNMALANEMSGNFEIALEWLDKSKKFDFIYYESIYRQVILERIKTKEKLNSN